MNTPHHARRRTTCSAIAAGLVVLGGAAGGQQAGVTEAKPTGLETITVEARRQRAALEHAVDSFIRSITVHSNDEALARWSAPICPLVAGLSRDMGEFVLRRVSEVATEAGAPLAPEKCQANFFLVVTPDSDGFLKKWRARDPRMFDDDRGVGGINRFLASTRPVRVWYNAVAGCPGGLTSGLGLASPGQSATTYPTCANSDGMRTKLKWETVRGIVSVIVVVDRGRIGTLGIGQLSDYVAMVGLAQLQLERNPGPMPTILRLFAATGDARPPSLSQWDESFLKSLYHTAADDKTQVSEMQTRMVNAIAP